MLGKKSFWLIIVGLCWLCAGPTMAAEPQKIIIDNFGNINCYWLETITKEGQATQQLKQSFFDKSDVKTLFSVSQEVASFDLCRNNDDINIIIETTDHLLIPINATNGGRGSTIPQAANFSGQNPVIARYDRDIIIACEKTNSLKIRQSHDGGLSFDLPVFLQITGEVVSCPQIVFDKNNQFRLIFLSQNKLSGQYRIWQSTFIQTTLPAQLQETRRQLIYQTYNKINNLHFNQPQDLSIISWQEQAPVGQQNFYSLSLDQGQTYNPPKQISLPENIHALGFYRGKFSALTFEDSKIKVSEIITTIPNTAITTTNSPLLTNNTTAVLLSCSNTNSEPILYQLAISPQAKPNQPVFTQSQLAAPSDAAVTFSVSPETLVEGNYVWQVTANTGTAQSQPTRSCALIIDKTPPALITLEAHRSFSHASFTGQLDNSRPRLAINEQPQALGVSNTFCATFELMSGNNVFCFKISDEANNLLLISREVFYDPSSPEVAVILGNGQDWLKSGTTVLLQAKINDPKNIIGNKESPQLTLAGQNSDALLVYDEETCSLSGFINLPAGLRDGLQPACLTFQSQNGASLVFPFTIKIGTSPEAASLLGNTVTTEATFLGPPPTVDLLTNLATGPNPFSPSRELPGAFAVGGENKGMVFAYSLVQPADIKIRIYDITGTLIWVKELPAATSGVTAWGGVDQSGQIAPNGIYPFFFTVSTGGTSQTRRGKIIVYQ